MHFQAAVLFGIAALLVRGCRLMIDPMDPQSRAA
jgi:hypothetical protein